MTRGEDQYFGPTEIRLDALSPGYTEQKRVSRDEGERGGIQFRAYGEPLAFYEKKGIISLTQKRNGEKFYRTWYYGCWKSPYVLMRWEETRSGNAMDQPLLSEQYRAAMLAMQTLARRRIAYRVCCEGVYAGRGNVEMLRDALDDLINHFKKQKKADDRTRSDE
jgi:hypothetical protein